MDAKELRELIEIISRSNFSTFELEREGFKLKLVKDGTPSPAAEAVGAPEGAPGPSSAAPVPAVPELGASDLVELKSPIVGTFYGAPSPGAPSFVEVGDRVRQGQVLCIVEAMKLMNEIEAEMDAEIVEVVAANGQPVEYGDVLFRYRPLS